MSATTGPAPAPQGTFDARVLDLDLEAEATRICAWIVETLGALRRRGAVIAMSGGIDSSVCAALAVRALGAPRVFGLLLPERESSEGSTRLGTLLATHLGIAYRLHDLTDALEAVGCYRDRDAAIREVFPAYGPGWRSKLAIAGGLSGGLNYFRLVVRDPQGQAEERRLPHQPYLQIVAATNHKQRLRKAMEYHHADRLNYGVVGTPNRLEYDQGFFVKNGDGAADLKPIAHLYKTQVYAMARHLGLPDALCGAVPTTDTYTLAQGQDEFYFALPHARMDLALWARDHAVAEAVAAPVLGLTPEQVGRVYRDIDAKRRAAVYLGAPPRVIDPA